MKKYFLFTLLPLSIMALSQVGINTTNPQGIFHVDGNKDNPSTGTPSVLQQQNDFVVKSSGNVGIGTVNPTAKLHTYSNANYGAFQMQDGSQGTGKVLASDASGKGTWVTNVAITPISFGTLNYSTQMISSNKNLGHTLTLKQGRWLIYVGQLLNSNSPGTATDNMWVRFTFSDSSGSITATNYSYIGSSIASGWLAPSQYPGNSAFSFISGVIPVNVTSNSATLYLWTGIVDVVGTPPTTFVTANGENYLFAVPAA